MSNQRIPGMAASLSDQPARKGRPISFQNMKVNQVKAELAAQLHDKDEVINKAGTSQISRNALIKQSDLIRRELNELQHFNQEEELPIDLQNKLEGLANEFQYLKNNKPTTTSDFSSLLPPPPTTSSPSKHRSKPLNGSRRNPDIEFATEIGQGLLIEVRKLQVALQEKDEIIKQLELSKADTERNQETTQRHFKQREEIEERLKEENWNLEVANQELRTHLSESNQSVAKLNTDYGRLNKQLKNQAEQLDIMKAQEEKSASVVEAMKARHEQETHQLRRHAATFQRENAQVQKQVEALNTELKICKAKLAIKMAANNTRPDDSNQESSKDSSSKKTDDQDGDEQQSLTPPTSPGLSSRNQVMEAETLKQSLAHAHRIISNLRSSYHKEKLEKFEIKKMLSDSQENIEQMRKEMASWNSNITPSSASVRSKQVKKNKKKTVSKGKSIARQPRGLCLNESSSSDSELYDTDDATEEDDDVMNHFMLDVKPGNTLDGFQFQGGTSFSSAPMVPLSSELGQKVQVVDVGVNTVTQLDGGATQFDTVTQQKAIEDALQKRHQEIVTKANAILTSEQLEALVEHQVLTANDIQKEVIPETTIPKQEVDQLIQTAVSDALHKAQQEESAKLDTLKKESATAIAAAVAAAELVSSESAQRALDAEKTRVAETMVSKEEALGSTNQAIEKIKSEHHQQLAAMVPREELDRVTQESNASLEKIKTEMVPKSQLESMVPKEAIEQIQAEHQKKMETMVPQEEVEQIKMEHQKEMETMVPKTQLHTAVKEAVDKTRSEMLTDFQQQQQQNEAKLIDKEEEMVTKKEAEALALEAAAIERARVEQEHLEKTTELRSMGTDEGMISKKEVDKMAQVALDREKRRWKEDLEKEKSIMASEKTQLEQLLQQYADTSSAVTLEKTKLEEALEQQKAMLITEKEQWQQLLDQEKQTAVSEKEQWQQLLDQEKQTAVSEKEKLQALHQETLTSEKQSFAEQQEQLEKNISEHQSRIDTLTQDLESFKKEAELATLAQKDQADQLVQLSVAKALEAERATLKKQKQEEMAEMIPKDDVKMMIEAEVTKALDTERKEVAQREEEEAIEMISKAEASALAKVAAADAIVKERQASAAREAELMTKEEAEMLSQTAAREAAERERNELNSVLTRERKQFREKEDRMMSKEDAEAMSANAVREALEKYKKEQQATLTEHRNVSEYGSATVYNDQQVPSVIERSVSTSRLAPPAVNVQLAPSISTPTSSSSRSLRSVSSISSLRLGRKDDSKRPLNDAVKTTPSFGSLLIREQSKYSHKINGGKTPSLRELSKQGSVASFSTISSSEHLGRAPLPMSSEESFAGFSNTSGTDMYVISSITQTMIGEWMLKYTRRYGGRGISDNKHSRFFWVHPYTKTLYWSSIEPGVDGNETKAKSASIESVSSIPSNDTTGASPMSLIIKTPKRDLKLTASTLERHDIWFKSLSYLLRRPDTTIPEEPRVTVDGIDAEGNITLGTKTPDSVAQYDSDDSDDNIDIRKCCDGKHDISTLSKEHSHHHHA
ncbi:hypothetical protein K501DRAFT_230742 [Backusella circina FSU 941]|nr:hypothetical protein K501DRAFT_230742 [Backusella circina FSU 941]